MKFKFAEVSLLAAIFSMGSLFAGCGGSSGVNYVSPAGTLSGLTNGSSLPLMSGDNVLELTVNGALCSSATSAGYPNKPCVSVTICDSNGANCQTISDILLDTGSFGLRVFQSALTPSLANALTPVTTAAGRPVAECVKFQDNSADWGPVEMASVGLGGEPSVRVPVQVINSNFANASRYCPNADTTPVQAGFNGILGVGVFVQDCGDGCAKNSGNGMYFSCDSASGGASCSGLAAPLSQQVTNPVSALPVDNNGVIVELPSVDFGGVPSVSGYVVLGIGTQSDNMPAGVTAYSVDPVYGEYSTTFEGRTYPQSFVDSGSNALFFDPPSSVSSLFPDCSQSDSSLSPGWYCPSSLQVFSAASTGESGSAGPNTPFAVGNFIALASSSNAVFVELGAAMNDGGQALDFGLPFFFGRNIYVGLEHSSSTLGSGPYWAY